MTKRHSKQKVGGYAWKRCIERISASNATARKACATIHTHLTTENTVSRILISQLTAEAALALAENLEALRTLEQIVKQERESG